MMLVTEANEEETESPRRRTTVTKNKQNEQLDSIDTQYNKIKPQITDTKIAYFVELPSFTLNHLEYS